MRRATALLLLVLGCGLPRVNALDGAWQSNRDLTLQEFRAKRSWTPEQWETLASQDMFGHMVYVFQGNQAIVVFDDLCSARSSFEKNSSASQILFPGTDPDEPPVAITREDDRLYVPVSLLRGGLRETFIRTELDLVVQRHPCVGDFVSTRSESAR